jgi:hypothetical protein
MFNKNYKNDEIFITARMSCIFEKMLGINNSKKRCWEQLLVCERKEFM